MTTTTSIYSSPIQSSFPLDALTTTFTPPASCSGIYRSGGVAVIDADLACLPQGFTSLSTNYFSPGIQCPAGYVTACNDNAGVSSITTVTCCPYRGDITLGCVTPSTLSNVWKTLFCTWIAPESGTTVSITQSEDGTTSTAAVSMSSPGGINALGIRMVYQSSDIATASGTGATSGTATATSTGGTSTGSAADTDDSSSGLSTGVIIAIAVIIPVVLIAVVAGLFFFIRRRKQAQKAQQPGEGAAGVPYDYSKNGYSAVAPGAGGYYDPKSPAPPSEVSGVGASGVKNQQQELAELGQQELRVELPAEHYR